jgi:hypothetical protein
MPFPAKLTRKDKGITRKIKFKEFFMEMGMNERTGAHSVPEAGSGRETRDAAERTADSGSGNRAGTRTGIEAFFNGVALAKKRNKARYDERHGIKISAGCYGAETAGNGSLLKGGSECAFVAGMNSAVKAGHYSAIEAGAGSTAKAGHYSAIAGGDKCDFEGREDCAIRAHGNSSVRAGDISAVNAGYNCVLVAGNYSTINAGTECVAKAGNDSTVTAGYDSVLKAGKRSVVVGGEDSRVAAGMGSIIAVSYTDAKGKNRVAGIAVDGKKVKPNDFYEYSIAQDEFVKSKNQEFGL